MSLTSPLIDQAIALIEGFERYPDKYRHLRFLEPAVSDEQPYGSTNKAQGAGYSGVAV